MANDIGDLREAGWKPDPAGRFAGRYWDGSAWTEHVYDKHRVQQVDPPDAAAPPTSAAPRPRRLPPGKPSAWPEWARYAVPIGVAVVLLIGLAVRADRRDAGGGGRSGPAPASEVKTYAVGETARTGNLDVTVLGFKDPQPPGPFIPPGAGNHFVSVDVQLANRGANAQGFSSLLQLHLADAADRQFNSTFGEVTPPAPDGDIAPGGTIRGMVLFAVPDGTTGLRFRVQGTLGGPAVTFALA